MLVPLLRYSAESRKVIKVSGRKTSLGCFGFKIYLCVMLFPNSFDYGDMALHFMNQHHATGNPEM